VLSKVKTGDAGHADRNGKADGTRSKICRGAPRPIIVRAGRNGKRNASEILVAGWERASVGDDETVGAYKRPGLVGQAADVYGNFTGARRSGGKRNGYERACEAANGFHSAILQSAGRALFYIHPTLHTFVTAPDVTRYLPSDVKATPQPASSAWRRPFGTRS